MNKPLIGVVIDKENMSKYCKNTLNQKFDIKRVMEKIKELGGTVVLGRAYFALGYDKTHKENKLPSMLPEGVIYTYFIYGIEVVPVPTLNHKNIADSYIIADVMEYLFIYDHIDTWVIVTGDKDFIPLIRKIKLHGKNVVVIGPKSSTGRFEYLYDECERLGIDYYAYDDIMIKMKCGGKWH